ncbi:hypothetical protein QQ045_022783 [Rhodiola kirilowii]
MKTTTASMVVPKLRPTKGLDEFQPFVWRLPKFKFWAFLGFLWFLNLFAVVNEYNEGRTDAHATFMEVDVTAAMRI